MAVRCPCIAMNDFSFNFDEQRCKTMKKKGVCAKHEDQLKSFYNMDTYNQQIETCKNIHEHKKLNDAIFVKIKKDVVSQARKAFGFDNEINVVKTECKRLQTELDKLKYKDSSMEDDDEPMIIDEDDVSINQKSSREETYNEEQKRREYEEEIMRVRQEQMQRERIEHLERAEQKRRERAEQKRRDQVEKLRRLEQEQIRLEQMRQAEDKKMRQAQEQMRQAQEQMRQAEEYGMRSEERIRRVQEEQARRLQEEQARRSQEEQARRLQEEQARRSQEEQARRNASSSDALKKDKEAKERERRKHANMNKYCSGVVALYYRLLGLTINANQDDVKKAYRKLCLVNHPDKGGSTEQFNSIKKPYDFIMALYTD